MMIVLIKQKGQTKKISNPFGCYPEMAWQTKTGYILCKNNKLRIRCNDLGKIHHEEINGIRIERTLMKPKMVKIDLVLLIVLSLLAGLLIEFGILTFGITLMGVLIIKFDRIYGYQFVFKSGQIVKIREPSVMKKVKQFIDMFSASIDGLNKQTE